MKKKIIIICIFSALIISAVLYLSCGEIVFESSDASFVRGEMTVEYMEDYTIPSVSSKYVLSLGEITIPCRIENGINNEELGNYILSYKSSFLFVHSQADINVSVIDTVPPVITLNEDPDYWIFPYEEYEEEGFVALDNHDGCLSEKVICTKNEEGNMVYTVSDSSGNYAKAVRTVKYKDTNAPVITVSQSYIAIKLGSSYTLPSASALDSEDGDVTDGITVSHNINNNKVGCYMITYTASDKWGNTASKYINVYVYRNNLTSAAAQYVNKSIYLTFDDGPSAYTAQLLDILDKYDVKATFFATNIRPYYRDMIGECYRRGHTIGVHTYTHNYAYIYSSEQAFWADNTQMNDIIYAQTGRYSDIMRFAGGSSNTISRCYKKGIMTSLAASASVMGFRYFDWNVDSMDAMGATTAEEVFNNVKNQCSSKNVCVVLQHDCHKFSVEAVEEIITWGLANGYTFLPITDTTPNCHHWLAN